MLFMVNGNIKGYDAALCTQAFRPPASTKGTWNQGKQSTSGLVHGEGKVIKCWYGGTDQVRRSKDKGGVVKESRDYVEYQVSTHADVANGSAIEGEGISTLNEKVKEHGTHGQRDKEIGRSWMTQERGIGPMSCNLGWGINEFNGINSLLRARRDKLMKTQSKYWVEFVDEDEDGTHKTEAIIPVHNPMVGELAQCIRDFSLKRKLNEQEESPRPKRRKDHLQESPRSAGEREKAISELQIIAKMDGSSKFNFNYDGDLCFCMGGGEKGHSWLRKKTKRELFSNSIPESQLVMRVDAFNHEKEANLLCGSDMVEDWEGHGGWPEIVTQEP